jgi:hypothetical protein
MYDSLRGAKSLGSYLPANISNGLEYAVLLHDRLRLFDLRLEPDRTIG